MADRYEELMARRAALEAELHERMRRHHEVNLEQMPALGSSAQAFGSHTDGIRLARDGSLDALLELTDIHGRKSTVVLRADPGGAPVELGGTSRATDEPRRALRAGDETAERLEAVKAVANEHLPSRAAEAFVALLRPALRLEPAGEGDPVVAQLGGLPKLPTNTWPVWDGHGPLSHVLTFDCGTVDAILPELGIPASGALAFFYYDGSFDDHISTVGTWDAATRPGFRVLHTRADQAAPHDRMDLATPVPPGLTAFPAVALTAVRTLSWPAHESAIATGLWAEVGLADEATGGHSPVVQELYAALDELPNGGWDTHQIGGYPTPQQGAVELEVEQLSRGLAGQPFAWDDPGVASAAAGWRLLLQLASDDEAGMMWGDVGQLYYLVRDPLEPEEALFTWQCG